MSVEMSNTGLKINYSVRPAKNIERKMMKDIFSRLFVFAELSEYQYIGFGSKYFTDFVLFHRSVGFQKMISIEGDYTNKERYEFNKPYDFIEMNFGHSSHVLPRLKYSHRAVVWLDFDYAFNKQMLSDLIFLVENLKSGSILSFSFSSEIPNINVLKDKYKSIDKGFYKRYFEDIFGDIGIDLEDRGWNKDNRYINFINERVYSRLVSSIERRNSDLGEEDRFNLEQIFYFSYADGIPMTTIGWVLFAESERYKFDALSLNNFNYYIKQLDNPYIIGNCPLTIKEIHLLMAKMPLNETDDLPINPVIIPETMQRDFAKHYQYFPSFHEVEAY